MVQSPLQSLIDLVGGLLYTLATTFDAMAAPTAAFALAPTAAVPTTGSTDFLGSYQCLSLSFAAPGVLNVHLRIGKLNAMSQRFWREMRECFTKIGQATEVRAVLITAEGKVRQQALVMTTQTPLVLLAAAAAAAATKRGWRCTPRRTADLDIRALAHSCLHSLLPLPSPSLLTLSRSPPL